MKRLEKLRDFALDTAKVGIQTLIIAAVATGFGWLMQKIVNNDILVGIGMIVAFVTMTIWSVFVMVGPPWNMERTPWLKWIGLGKQPSGDESAPKPTADPMSKEELPKGVQLSAENWEQVKEIVQIERNNARSYKFLYLRLFLVQHTIQTLLWFSTLATATSFELCHIFLSTLIPDERERKNVLDVLMSNRLIEEVGQNIRITQEGRDFLAWYARLPAS